MTKLPVQKLAQGATQKLLQHVYFRLIGAIGVPCSTQEDCSRLANTECMSTCRCVLGYGGPDCDLCKYGVSI